MRTRVAPLILAALAFLAPPFLAPPAARADDGKLAVYAAASLTDVVNGLAKQFTGATVVPSYGSSSELARQIKRPHAVEMRHGKIRKDEIRTERRQRPAKALLGFDGPVGDAQAGALQLVDRELGVGLDIFDQQYAEFPVGHAPVLLFVPYGVGVRLIASQ